MTANVRGFALGLLTIVVLSGITWSAVFILDIPGALLLMWIVPPAGGFIAARIASTHRLLLAASLALPSAAFSVTIGWIWLSRNVLFSGGGKFGVDPIGLALCLLLGFVGGALGILSKRRMPPNTSLERTRER